MAETVGMSASHVPQGVRLFFTSLPGIRRKGVFSTGNFPFSTENVEIRRYRLELILVLISLIRSA